jgi:putative flippase GtrA
MRWLRFNLIGMAGACVQLATLGWINRAMPGHYEWTSTAAIELAILHNYFWHCRCTWRDRSGRFLRFQLSSGVVSLGGNLALMPVLVDVAHVRVLIANAIAIAVCSLANYWLANRWAFAAIPSVAPGTK